MTDQPRWLQRLTQLARPARPDPTPERSTGPAQATESGAPAADYEAGRIDLGGGAALYLPAGRDGTRLQGQDSEAAAADSVLADLISRADRAEFDAERLDDADLSGQAAAKRQQAAELRGDAYRHEFQSWVERGGVELGHGELMNRIQARANTAHRAGDRALWWQLTDVIDRLDGNFFDDQQVAIETAVTLPEAERPAYLAGQQDNVRRYAQGRIADLVDDLDLTVAEPVDETAAAKVTEEARHLQHLDQIDDDVRSAYELALGLRAADDDKSEDTGSRWLYLSDLRAAVDDQTQMAQREPHSREEIDAALRRLTRDQTSTVHVIPEDHDHLLTDADREAAVRFGGADRHMIRIDYPEPAAVAPDNGWHDQNADQAAVEQADEFVEKSAGEHFEDYMEAGAVQFYAEHDKDLDGNDLDDELDDDDLDDAGDVEDAARGELPGKEQRGELTDTAEVAEERAAEASEDHTAVGDDAAVRDDSGVSETIDAAEAAPVRESAAVEKPAEEKTAEANAAVEEMADEPVAVAESTACAVAVTRAQCVVDRARQQLDAVEQGAAAERDEELARWHADDTAQADNERIQSDSAAQDSAPVRGE